MNLNKALMKESESKSFSELADAPVTVIAGVSDNDAKLLAEAFNVKTVRDLANLKYVKWAQAIVTGAEVEE
jgi:metallophosphoesterase superfamily enzyme